MQPNVIIADQSNFEQEVIQRSRALLVLVDFWAPWCGPCRMLTPVLEQLAAESEGRWLLAKVNTDENQPLARRYGVQGIPNVKAFRNGEVVGEFVGAQPRPAVQRFLEKFLPNQLDESVREAEALIEREDLEAARAALEAVLGEKPDHEGAHLALARVELAEGNVEAALQYLEAIPARSPLGARAEQLRAQAHLASGPTGEMAPLAARVEAEPDNLDARHDLALAAARARDYEVAAKNLLYILERDRGYREGAARKALLDLFKIMGEEDPRTKEYRQKMSWILFS